MTWEDGAASSLLIHKKIMKQGIDRTFLHYGIRTQDLSAIINLCEKYGLDSEWIKEDILKAFHEQRINDVDLDDKAVMKIINKALLNIK